MTAILEVQVTRRGALSALLALAATALLPAIRVAAQTTEAPPLAAPDEEKSGESPVEQEKKETDEVKVESEEVKTPHQLRQEKRESISGEKVGREKQDREPVVREKAERKKQDRKIYERRKVR